MKPAFETFGRADRLAGLFAPAVVDIFAGCGGWSIGAEQAFVEGGFRDRYIDLMINHWDVAVGVHQANHPLTLHLQANILEVDPNEVLPGRDIVYLHASPDCCHHSRAKGGQPLCKNLRALADVVPIWARKRRPAVITLENVPEFADWGDLLKSGRPCPRRKGRLFRKWVGELEAMGYAVQWRALRACDYGAPTTRKRLFVIARCDGKEIIWPEKTHGNVTTEAQRHGENDQRPRSNDQANQKSKIKSQKSLLPFLTAAECIDWSIPMLSIFATPAQARAFAAAVNVGREKHERIGVPRRPLKAKTLQRIARGLMKFVIHHPRPFIVQIENYGNWTEVARPVDEPLTTVTATPKGGKHALVTPIITQLAHGGGGTFGNGRESSVNEPLRTIHAGGNNQAIAAATLAPFTAGCGGRAGQTLETSAGDPLPTVTGKADQVIACATLQTLNHGGEEHRGQSPAEPLHTVTGTRDARALVAALVTKHRGDSPGSDVGEPLPTVTAGAGAKRDAGAAHAMGVTCAYLSHLYGTNLGTNGEMDSPLGTVTGSGNHAALIAAFLSTYYGNTPDGNRADEPMPTVVSKDRIQLVTVLIDGQTYVITDIAMRMLTPRELARAQGFPADYIIDQLADGTCGEQTRISRADQVKLIGNSVPPAFARAIVRDNVVKQGVLWETRKARREALAI